MLFQAPWAVSRLCSGGSSQHRAARRAAGQGWSTAGCAATSPPGTATSPTSSSSARPSLHLGTHRKERGKQTKKKGISGLAETSLDMDSLLYPSRAQAV